jgi:biotin carboxyl carrier protein
MPGISEDGEARETTPLPSMAVALGAFVSLLHLEGRIGIQDVRAERRRQRSPWNSLSGSWMMGGQARRTLQLADGTSASCTCHRDGSYDIQIMSDDETIGSFHINGSVSPSQEMEVIVNHTHRISFTTALHEENGLLHVCMWPQSSLLRDSNGDNPSAAYFWEVKVENPLLPSSFLDNAAGPSGHGTVKAPMPGKISRINFQVGDMVEQGDVLLLMEAMKMEHQIISPVSGIVESMPYEVNDVVGDGMVLANVKSTDEEALEAASE